MELSEIRKEIDAIDVQIKDLFLKRMSFSEKVAEEKIKKGLPVLNQAREDEIVENLTRGEKAEDAKALESLYRNIFEISRDRQINMMK